MNGQDKVVLPSACRYITYRIAGNFRESKYWWFSKSSQFVVLFLWLLLALKVKVGKVASFVGNIFVVQCSTTKPRMFCPTKITRYTVGAWFAWLWVHWISLPENVQCVCLWWAGESKVSLVLRTVRYQLRRRLTHWGMSCSTGDFDYLHHQRKWGHMYSNYAHCRFGVRPINLWSHHYQWEGDPACTCNLVPAIPLKVDLCTYIRVITSTFTAP